MSPDAVLPAFVVAGIASVIFINATASSPDFYADLLCWGSLLGGLRTYRYLHPDEQVEHGSSDESNALGLAIVVATVCRIQADTNWIVPFLTPAIFLVLQRVSSDYLPLSTADDSNQTKAHLDQYLHPAATLLLVAVASCLAFAPSYFAWSNVIVGCLFLCSQTAAYYFFVVRKQQSPDETLKVTVSSLEPVSYRVIAMLAIMMLTSPHPLPSIPSIGFDAIFKAAFWVTALVLCRKAHPTTMSSLYTFSLGAVYAHEQTIPWQAMAAAIASVVALWQTLTSIPRGLLDRKVGAALVIIPVLALLTHPLVTGNSVSQVKWSAGLYDGTRGHTSTVHPIDELVQTGRQRFQNMLQTQSRSLPQAVSEYKRRYGRPPPPHFDIWYAMAVQNNVTLIDEYDTVMQALEPFWGVRPAELRARTEAAVKKGGSLTKFVIEKSEIKIGYDPAVWLSEEIKSWMPAFLKYLPDMTLAINILDEPRVILANDMLDATMQHRQDLVEHGAGAAKSVAEDADVTFIESGKQKIWEILKVACPVNSPARTSSGIHSIPSAQLEFVGNATAAQEVCSAPERAASHGFFTSPSTFQFTHTLVPIFSQAKPSLFQDILFPSPYYTESYDLGKYKEAEDIPWEQKKNKLYWAGSTSGGHSTRGSWHFQHRQKFVALANDRKQVFTFLNETRPRAWEAHNATMGNLLDRFDVKFTSAIQCDEDDCEDERKQFHFGQRESMAEGYASRLIYDIDGNGLSGRFYQLLGSRSAVLKQTLFQEWHSDWLVPWVHYIPVSMTLDELPETVRYLTTTPQGQQWASDIATAGQQWSNLALRKVDLALVFFRILLEYGRLMDDDRASLNCDC